MRSARFRTHLTVRTPGCRYSSAFSARSPKTLQVTTLQLLSCRSQLCQFQRFKPVKSVRMANPVLSRPESTRTTCPSACSLKPFSPYSLAPNNMSSFTAAPGAGGMPHDTNAPRVLMSRVLPSAIRRSPYRSLQRQITGTTMRYRILTRCSTTFACSRIDVATGMFRETEKSRLLCLTRLQSKR